MKKLEILTFKVGILMLVLLAGMIISLVYDKQLFTLLFGAFEGVLNPYFLVITDARLVILMLYLLPCIYLLKDKRRAYIPFILASLAVAFVFSSLLKLGVERLRPFLMLQLMPTVIEHTNSFPSNHAAIAFAAIPILAFLLRRARVVLISYAVLVAFSRIYLGVHYLSDIFAGVMLGLAVGYFLWYFKDEKVTAYSLEYKRQILHILWGGFIVLLLYIEYINVFHILAALVLGLVLSFVSLKRNIFLVSWFLDNFDRGERIPGWGAITLFAGIAITLLLFSQKSIALASIMVLTLGDSMSTIIGTKYGRTRNPLNKAKSVQGSLAGLAFGIAGAMLFVPWIIAIPGAIAGMLVEAVQGRSMKISDNIAIPLVSGVVMSLIKIFLV